MGAMGDNWAAGPVSTRSSAPPRPDQGLTASALPSPRLAPPAQETFATAPGWKRAGAVLGVVGAFFFFLTIPGWLALGRYKKWKAGEIPTPDLLIGWGYVITTLFVIAMISTVSGP